MKSIMKFFKLLSLLLFSITLAACGGGGGGSNDSSAPTVLSESPSDSTQYVALRPTISVTFSEAMDQGSAETAVSSVPALPTGTFAWSGNTMSYTPAAELSYSTGYAVTVGTGAKDLAGNPLARAYTWSWTTTAQVSINNGSIKQIGNQRILNLWGSYYQMGYAHGYLLASDIRNLIDTFLIGRLCAGSSTRYNNFLDWSAAYITDYPDYRDEMNGMVAGMNASGKSLYVSSLRRSIDIRDIRALSLIVELYFHCSSFGVWGNATSGGETILARNWDFYYDPQGNFPNTQILITYQPTGKVGFVAFAWPGSVGIQTGLNEYGISVMTNMGNGANSSSNGPFHPSSEVYRYILENTTPANFWTQPLFIINSVQEFSPIIAQVASPYSGSQAPVYYLEDSPPSGKVIRYAADVDFQYNHIIATNYFLKVIPPITSGEEVTRYNNIRNGLINLYSTGNSRVDSTEAWSLLNTVAFRWEGSWSTLVSVVIRPNRMEFDLSFARMVGGVLTIATDRTPQTYTWASLFPNH